MRLKRLVFVLLIVPSLFEIITIFPLRWIMNKESEPWTHMLAEWAGL